MKRFLNIFKQKNCNVIGMIHVNALPGAPNYKDAANSWMIALEKARHEASIYAKYKLDAVLIENMHDIPYVREEHLGPETTACMARVSSEIRSILPGGMPCGIQILACGNRQALAVAKACNLQFIRSEAFVFGHVADEGYVDACAGDLLRYRKQIDAGEILIFTDIKKKHSAHAITQDVDLAATAKAAEFFSTDGIIITGNSTGHAASPSDLRLLTATETIKTPILIGSGVTVQNIEDYYDLAHGVIIGSHFKRRGEWQEELHEPAIADFMRKIVELRKSSII